MNLPALIFWLCLVIAGPVSALAGYYLGKRAQLDRDREWIREERGFAEALARELSAVRNSLGAVRAHERLATYARARRRASLVLGAIMARKEAQLLAEQSRSRRCECGRSIHACAGLVASDASGARPKIWKGCDE